MGPEGKWPLPYGIGQNGSLIKGTIYQAYLIMFKI